MMLALLAAVCYAFSIIATRTGLYDVEPVRAAFISLTHIGTAQTASLGSITPLFSSILAVKFLGEKMTHQLLLGMIIVIAGIWLVI